MTQIFQLGASVSTIDIAINPHRCEAIIGFGPFFDCTREPNVFRCHFTDAPPDASVAAMLGEKGADRAAADLPVKRVPQLVQHATSADTVRALPVIGHRQMAFDRSPHPLYTHQERLAGYRQALLEIGITDSCKLLGPTTEPPESFPYQSGGHPDPRKTSVTR